MRASGSHPVRAGGLTWCATSLDTPHGTVSVRWQVEGGMLMVTSTIPEGIGAILSLEGQPEVTMTGGSHTRIVEMT